MLASACTVSATEYLLTAALWFCANVIRRAVLERPFSVAVTGDRLTIADELIFVGGEAFKANRPAGVQFASADA